MLARLVYESFLRVRSTKISIFWPEKGGGGCTNYTVVYVPFLHVTLTILRAQYRERHVPKNYELCAIHKIAKANSIMYPGYKDKL